MWLELEMGIFLSAPKTNKISEDGENDRFRYGSSSMQGWCSTMEDVVSRLYYVILLNLHSLRSGYLSRECSLVVLFALASYVCKIYINFTYNCRRLNRKMTFIYLFCI